MPSGEVVAEEGRTKINQTFSAFLSGFLFFILDPDCSRTAISKLQISRAEQFYFFFFFYIFCPLFVGLRVKWAKRKKEKKKKKILFRDFRDILEKRFYGF